MTVFSSITVWQAEHYEVRVRVDGFASIEVAAAFGNAMELCLRLVGQRLVLVDPNGTQHTIDDAHLSVVRLRPESCNKLMTSRDDYEAVPITIAEFQTTPGLNRGFGSLAYGVRDMAGDTMPLPGHMPAVKSAGAS